MEKGNLEPTTALPILKSPELKKRRKNPQDLNPDCEKRATRGEAIDLGAKKVLKARRKKKALQSKVKSFNYFAYKASVGCIL